SATYKIADAYWGKYIACRATATNEAGNVTGRSAASVAGTGAALKVSSRPYLSGTHTHGKTEYAHNGTWTPAATSFTYQWYIGTSAIRGATRSYYTPPLAYKGKPLNCIVTAHRLHYANGASRTPSVTIL
ncbi:MAG: hypothetical protein QOD70_1122, partial [Frankiales bacterium]|nr:hypothetical protein [Frankiales bacterium]